MNVRQGSRRTLLSLAMLLSAGVVADPATVEFETGSYKAMISVQVDPDPGTLQVVRKVDDAGTQTRMLPIWLGLRHVADVREAHSKLLILGKTNQRNDLLVVYALPSLKLLDVILCRDVVLSPSARFAVFERFFPRMGTPARHSNHMTLLYDVRATPQQNRLDGVLVPDFESRPSRSIYAGYPIYPELGTDESQPYLLPEAAERVAKKRDHNPPYAWSHDESRIAFVVVRRTESTRERQLVVVGIDEDGRPVSRQEIGLAQVSGPPFIEIGFVGGSVRLARGDGGRKLIRIISPD